VGIVNTWRKTAPVRSVFLLTAAVALLPGCADLASTREKPDPKLAGFVYGRWQPAMNETPRPIAESDAELYRQIYAHQNREEWAAADRLIAQLDDKALVGHVLAARYLGSYTPNARELRDWMARYADHPDAERIARLGRYKRSRYADRNDGSLDAAEAGDSTATTSRRPRPPANHSRRSLTTAGGSIYNQYIYALRRGNPEAADAALNHSGAEGQLGRVRLDTLRTELAVYFMQAGKFERAQALAAAASRSKDQVPNAAWVAGLTSWKVGKHAEAAEHFEFVAAAKTDSDWLQARASFWAHRAHEGAGNAAGAKRALEKAATFPRTLYGMLARQKLGVRQDFNFAVAATPDAAHLAAIAASAEGKRAFGLIQVGMHHHAGEELLRHHRRNGGEMEQTYLAIADRGSLPDLAYHLAGNIYTRTGKTYDAGLFPLPDWRPADGFQVDRAVIFAIMRQESAFQSKVVSRANARGLMQLIPPTAASMAGDTSLRRERLGRLFDPEFNMQLGQRYLKMLLERETGGNVAFAAAAYNAGEGALMKWQLRDDALLFLATIPYNETRHYVERVLYNVSVYRLRLGQRPTELEALSVNTWPVYVAQDGKI
jgi:soluble lytic murein transglycosylase-like protein